MKTSFKTISLLFIILLTGYVSNAQVQYQQKNDFKLTVSGTSTMHDWEMKTTKIACNATFTVHENGNPSGLTQLSFTMAAESLNL